MTDDQGIPACDLCVIALVVEHDRNGKPLIRTVHHPGCPDAAPTADISRANT